jgi:hypothetical protein
MPNDEEKVETVDLNTNATPKIPLLEGLTKGSMMVHLLKGYLTNIKITSEKIFL